MEHARLVQAAGGTFNGSTHQDYTNYYEALPAEALERALFLEADRMAAPAITEENLRNQIDVVKEEIRVNVLNRPYGAFPWLQLPRIAFDSFANTHDGYGSFVDLESSTVADATDFFSRYYAPGNAVLCVGGDLDVAETEKLVERWFGVVPARDVPPTPATGEPLPTAVRRETVEDRLAPAPAVALGWRVPDPVGDFGTYLGTVLLAELLSEGDASRLERRLVHDDRIAIAQSSYVGLFGDPFDVRDATLLTTQVHHPAGVPVDRVISTVHEEIARIADEGVGDDELRRVLARTEAQLLRQADSILGRTLAFAAAEIIHGRAELAGELPAVLASVTREQVQQAARSLDPGTVAVLELRATGGDR
jgi:predicted Zn-dependent peptidase